VFIAKYAAGITLAINPSLATKTSVAVGLSLVYGAFSGLFLARAQSLRAVLESGLAARPTPIGQNVRPWFRQC
jgi:hypothetical protein